ncbi:plasmid pRiA4b ORF-3 family protein [Streptomyces alanosinicus]|uniref:Plasmid pRiA4b Orf3-like domain-containing protein n=1 Tax=Streptomyces alanosinicus TaxID=68171 RepID=A0A918YLR9_9ACTN|nr:plasmid pRiA4b ORF-3 family protein [Streptomyces alanosinicus]GHE08535.1 hypothetical protein GCM10010339_57660 [Streptomyces alanosinicus]
MKPSDSTIHQIKVSIRGSQPLIWRLIEVPSDVTLVELHNIIQAAFDWENRHMWEFSVSSGGQDSVRYDSEFETDEANQADEVRLYQVLPEAHTMLYTYDYGDNRELDITTQRIHTSEPGVQYPWCLDGAQAAPLEDCGGIDEYQRLLESLSSQSRRKDREEDRETLVNRGITDWFDADHFDVKKVNQALADFAIPTVANQELSDLATAEEGASS